MKGLLGEQFEIEAQNVTPRVGAAMRSEQPFELRKEMLLTRGNSLSSESLAVNLTIEGHKTTYPLSSRALQTAASELKSIWDGVIHQNGVVGISMAYGLDQDRMPKHGLVLDGKTFVGVFEKSQELKKELLDKAEKHMREWNDKYGKADQVHKRKWFQKSYPLRAVMVGNPYTGAVKRHKLYVDMNNWASARAVQNDKEVHMDDDCTSFSFRYLKAGGKPSVQALYFPYEMLKEFLDHPKLKEAVEETKRFLNSVGEPEEAEKERLYWSFHDPEEMDEETLRAEIKRRMRKRKPPPPPPAPPASMPIFTSEVDNDKGEEVKPAIKKLRDSSDEEEWQERHNNKKKKK